MCIIPGNLSGNFCPFELRIWPEVKCSNKEILGATPLKPLNGV